MPALTPLSERVCVCTRVCTNRAESILTPLKSLMWRLEIAFLLLLICQIKLCFTPLNSVINFLSLLGLINWNLEWNEPPAHTEDKARPLGFGSAREVPTAPLRGPRGATCLQSRLRRRRLFQHRGQHRAGETTPRALARCPRTPDVRRKCPAGLLISRVGRRRAGHGAAGTAAASAEVRLGGHEGNVPLLILFLNRLLCARVHPHGVRIIRFRSNAR